MNQHGAALVATLAVVMVLLPLGAFVVLQCRTDLMIEHNLRAEIEAFYVAEAGLEHALAEIPLGSSFDSMLAGPDQIPGTGDDGVFPFAEGPPSAFPYAPFRYEVHMTRIGDDLLSIVSSGIGMGAATRVVSALVRRSALPASPAALYAEGEVSILHLGGAGFLLSGADHHGGDAPSAPTGGAPPLPALATPSAGAEAQLRQQLSAADAQRLVGAGGTPSLATTTPLGIERYAAAALARPERVDVSPLALSGASVLGTPDAPQLSVAPGDLDISGQVSGSGLLIVQGMLHVSGALAFSGLVVAMGGVVCESTSNVLLVGAFWRAAGQDSRLQWDGSGAVMYGRDALSAVDTAFPGLLPHAAVVAGWLDQL